MAVTIQIIPQLKSYTYWLLEVELELLDPRFPGVFIVYDFNFV